jgi:hypothetical protein
MGELLSGGLLNTEILLHSGKVWNSPRISKIGNFGKLKFILQLKHCKGPPTKMFSTGFEVTAKLPNFYTLKDLQM